MNQKKMLVLAVLLAGVLAYIYLYEIPKTKEKEVADNVFKKTTETQLQTIEVKKGDRSVSLVNKKYNPESPKSDEDKPLPKADTQWELANLPGVPLDSSSVQALVTPLLALKTENAIPAEERDSDLSVYGLAAPEMTLQVKYSGGDMGIRLGKKNEYVYKRYFQLAGKDDIYLTNETLYSAADKGEKDFRKKDVVSFTDFEMKKVAVSRGSEKLVLEKKSDEAWRIVEPISATASGEKLRNLFKELRDMKADEFIDFAPADADAIMKQYQLDAPQFSAILERSSGDPLLLIASEVPVPSANAKPEASPQKVLVYRFNNLPFIVKVTNSPLGRISLAPVEYRERELFSWGADLVKTAILEHATGEPLHLTLDKDAWKVDGKEADQIFVQQLFKDLSDLKAESFAETAQTPSFGFDKPRLKVSIGVTKYGSDEKPEDKVLVVGSETSNGYFAAVGDLSEPFVISKESFRKIAPTKEQLLPAAPTPGPIAASTPAA